MPAPIMKKFLDGEIGNSPDFTSVKYLKITDAETLGAILAWKGAKPESENRHVRLDSNPTLVAALDNAVWVSEALSIGDRVGLGKEVREGLRSYHYVGSSPPPSETNAAPDDLDGLYTPTRDDVDTAYRRRCRPGESVRTETLLNWVEADLKAAGKQLISGWRDVVEKYCP